MLPGFQDRARRRVVFVRGAANMYVPFFVNFSFKNALLPGGGCIILVRSHSRVYRPRTAPSAKIAELPCRRNSANLPLDSRPPFSALARIDACQSLRAAFDHYSTLSMTFLPLVNSSCVFSLLDVQQFSLALFSRVPPFDSLLEVLRCYYSNCAVYILDLHLCSTQHLERSLTCGSCSTGSLAQVLFTSAETSDGPTVCANFLFDLPSATPPRAGLVRRLDPPPVVDLGQEQGYPIALFITRYWRVYVTFS